MEQNAVVFSNKRYLYVQFMLMLPITLGVGLILSIPIDHLLRSAGLDFCDWPLLLCWLGPIVYLLTYHDYVSITTANVLIVGPFRPHGWDSVVQNSSIQRVYFYGDGKTGIIGIEYFHSDRLRKCSFSCDSPHAINEILDHFKAIGIRTGVRGDRDRYGLKAKFGTFGD